MQLKATEQYFPKVLFIMLYKAVLTFESLDEPLKVTIQMIATEQYFYTVKHLHIHNRTECMFSVCKELLILLLFSFF